MQLSWIHIDGAIPNASAPDLRQPACLHTCTHTYVHLHACVTHSQVKTNFDVSRYSQLLSCMDSIGLEELIMAVRRQSQGFSRGSSTYRGVTAHPSGRWGEYSMSHN